MAEHPVALAGHQVGDVVGAHAERRRDDQAVARTQPQSHRLAATGGTQPVTYAPAVTQLDLAGQRVSLPPDSIREV